MKRSNDEQKNSGAGGVEHPREETDLQDALERGAHASRKRGSLFGVLLKGAAFAAGKRGMEEFLDYLSEVID